MTEHLPTEHTLSIREAAQHFGVGETTIRRRIQSGELRAFKLPTRGGFEWRVYKDVGGGPSTITGGDGSTNGRAVSIDDITPPDIAIFSGGGATTGGGGSTTGHHGELMANLVAGELQRLHNQNRHLQDQNIQLAGQVGYLQAQLQQAQERIRLLTMEKEPEEQSPEEPELEEQPSWWERLRRHIQR
jgi:excisionase family DNA binding protein